jgi:hypothetical protein
MLISSPASSVSKLIILPRKVLFVGADTQVESGYLHIVDGQIGYTSLDHFQKMQPIIKNPM